MRLKELIEGVEVERTWGSLEEEIHGIAYHSAQVRDGFLFAAIQGLSVDGHTFVEEALQKGGRALLVERGGPFPVPTIQVADSRKALARVSANYYGHPSRRMVLVGITGTNGKTTTSYLLESILKAAGFKVGLIGTIHCRYGDKETVAANTTPESLDLQRILAEMVASGVTHGVMEVSSHGLSLERVRGCHFDAAIFTNFTSDHLDYHKTLEDYFEAKRKLFSDVLRESEKSRRFAVTNDDDPKGEVIVEGVSTPTLHYGLTSRSSVTADGIRLTFEGLSCRVKTPQGEFQVHSKLIGKHNLYNILAAVAAGLGLGLSLEILKEGIETVRGVPGRLERVENDKGIHVLVDYAHTADALERVLAALRALQMEGEATVACAQREQRRGRIITVFGCGGDRDRTKRPRMGEAVGRLSDLSILTSDNPRTEDPLAIMEEAEVGLRQLGLRQWPNGMGRAWREERGYWKHPDRREAIRMAIRLAEPSDIVLIAGKGHEPYQIIGKDRLPFDDRLEARKALEEL